MRRKFDDRLAKAHQEAKEAKIAAEKIKREYQLVNGENLQLKRLVESIQSKKRPPLQEISKTPRMMVRPISSPRIPSKMWSVLIVFFNCSECNRLEIGASFLMIVN